MIAQLTMESAKAWVLVIGAITSPIVLIVMGFFQWKQNKRSERMEAQSVRMEQKVDKTVANTNHVLGESLRLGMISAQSLAKDGDPSHIEMAKRAELEYNNHQRQMAESEKLPATNPLTMTDTL